MKQTLTLDFETGNIEQYGRVASPWVNQIVAFGLKGFDTDYIVRYIYDDIEIPVMMMYFTDDTYRLLIGHNLKFDMLYLWDKIEFQDWILRGGKIYCTQLAEYLLTSHQNQYAALRELGKSYGCEQRIKYIEYFFEEDYHTSDIPEQFVLDDVESDVRDTQRIYEKQQYQLQNRSEIFGNLVDIQMDFLLATTEMEYNGMKVDLQRLRQNRTELQEELEEVESDITEIIKRYWNED